MTTYSVPVAVEVDPTTLRRSALGTISGVVHLRLGSQSFPEKAWNDCPVVIIGCWLKALRSVRMGSAPDAECPFMDGSFLFRVQPASSAWRIEGVANGAPVQVELVNPDELWQNVVRAGRLLVDECTNRGWRGREVVELAHLLSRITREGAA